MNPEVKDKWTTALRSGDYKQGKHVLRSGDNFCCLGVLCDLAVKEGVLPEPTNVGYEYSYADNRLILPDPVMKWAGFDLDVNHRNGRYVGSDGEGYLAEHNDAGDSFMDIANIIDKEF